MSFQDFHIDLYQDYLEGLSERNKLVKHNQIVAPKTKPQRTFARFESEEHIAQIQNAAGKNIVVVADYYGQRIGDADDKRVQLTTQIRFAVKRETGTRDETTAISDAVTKAETIMFQFMNMMEKDFADGCNALEALEPEKMNWTRIEEQPWLDGYYGWDLNVLFKSYIPEHLEDDWEEA